MFRRIISSALALSMVFGAVAFLPEGGTAQNAITARAYETYGDYEYTVLDDGTVEITDYNDSDTQVTIPSKIDGKSVTSIGDYAFAYCECLKSITIPNSVTSISAYAFDNCKNLACITIPNSVTSIGAHAFENCTSLTSITIPDSVKSIGDSAFIDCKSLKNVTIPKSVKSIGDKAFGYYSDKYHNIIKLPGFKIYCYKGTAGKKYAEYNGFDHKYLKSIESAKVTLSKTSYTYTGKAKKPSVTVKLSGKTLKKGTDYTVSYKNNKKVGKATVKITGINKYGGTISKTFKIKPKATAVKTLTSPMKAQLKVTYNKVKGATGYQVTYSTSKKFTKATTKTVTVKGAGKLSKTVKSLKKGKAYYVKVRAYKTVSGTKYYSSYTAAKKIKVK